MQIGDFTAIEGTIFNIREFKIRPHEWTDDIHVTITYEFDLDLYRIDRETYNTLDWLGDLGGLYEALMIILGLIYGLFHYKLLENYLVS